VRFRRTILASLLVLGSSPDALAQSTSVISAGSGAARRNVLIVTPAAKPLAAVVMFPGGDGQISISAGGTIAKEGNFLLRTRVAWLTRGFIFAAVDAGDGGPGRGDRTGPGARQAIADIVRAIRARTPAPIWLLGTSAGAPAALAGAASLPAGSVRGVVISSPVSVPGPRDTVFDAALNQVRVAVRIQVHRDDGCRLSPAANAPAIKAALTAAPLVEIETFTGGGFARSGPCEAFAPHGFVGIEDQVVAAAAAWILAH